MNKEELEKENRESIPKLPKAEEVIALAKLIRKLNEKRLLGDRNV